MEIDQFGFILAIAALAVALVVVVGPLYVGAPF